MALNQVYEAIAINELHSLILYVCLIIWGAPLWLYCSQITSLPSITQNMIKDWLTKKFNKKAEKKSPQEDKDVSSAWWWCDRLPCLSFHNKSDVKQELNKISEVTDEKLGPAFHIYLMNV